MGTLEGCKGMGISRRRLLAASARVGIGGAGVVAGQGNATGVTRFGVSRRRLMLTHTWTIARNSSDFKDNVFVRIERDGIVGWGEAAPNVRYGQSAEGTIEMLEKACSSGELVPVCGFVQAVGARAGGEFVRPRGPRHDDPRLGGR